MQTFLSLSGLRVYGVHCAADTSFGFGGGDDLLYAMTTVETWPGYADLLKKGFTE